MQTVSFSEVQPEDRACQPVGSKHLHGDHQFPTAYASGWTKTWKNGEFFPLGYLELELALVKKTWQKKALNSASKAIWFFSGCTWKTAIAVNFHQLGTTKTTTTPSKSATFLWFSRWNKFDKSKKHPLIPDLLGGSSNWSNHSNSQKVGILVSFLERPTFRCYVSFREGIWSFCFPVILRTRSAWWFF